MLRGDYLRITTKTGNTIFYNSDGILFNNENEYDSKTTFDCEKIDKQTGQFRNFEELKENLSEKYSLDIKDVHNVCFTERGITQSPIVYSSDLAMLSNNDLYLNELNSLSSSKSRNNKFLTYTKKKYIGYELSKLAIKEKEELKTLKIVEYNLLYRLKKEESINILPVMQSESIRAYARRHSESGESMSYFDAEKELREDALKDNDAEIKKLIDVVVYEDKVKELNDNIKKLDENIYSLIIEKYERKRRYYFWGQNKNVIFKKKKILDKRKKPVKMTHTTKNRISYEDDLNDVHTVLSSLENLNTREEHLLYLLNLGNITEELLDEISIYKIKIK